MKLSGIEMSYTWPVAGIHETVRYWNVVYITSGPLTIHIAFETLKYLAANPYSVWWSVMLGTIIPNITGPSTNPKCSTKIPSNNVFCEALCPHLHCSLSLSQSWVPVLFSLKYVFMLQYMWLCSSGSRIWKGGFQSALGHYTWRRACSPRKILDFRPSEVISGAVLGWAALCKRGD